MACVAVFAVLLLTPPFALLSDCRPCRLLIGLWIVALSLVGCGSNGEIVSPETDPADGFSSHPSSIVVDGEGEDWGTVPLRHDDAGDGERPLGIERLWIAHSESYVFLRLTTDRRINLAENNDLTLHIDTDNDRSTGESALGLGADLTWTFGDREGSVRGTTVGHEDIGLVSLPTVRADTFEIALDRNAEVGGTPVFSGDSVRVALSSGGDRLPDDGGGLGYVVSGGSTDVETPSLNRPASSEVRLVTYNVINDFEQEQNTLFQDHTHPSHRRILNAIGPDVIGYQEMFNETADEVEHVVEDELGAVPSSWEWTKTANELVLGTQFSIQETAQIPGADSSPSGAFLLDTQTDLGTPLLVVLMHAPCCNDPGSDEARQETVDGVAAFLRDLQNGTGPLDVPPKTPIVVMGDMNFVGDPQQPRTLRTGTIINTGEFGPSALPDWGESPLLDTKPRQTGAPLHVTTFNPESDFSPSRLDYAYVTNSVLEVVHEFVLSTRALSEAARSEHGLDADDTTIASDHLPVVIDVRQP